MQVDHTQPDYSNRNVKLQLSAVRQLGSALPPRLDFFDRQLDWSCCHSYWVSVFVISNGLSLVCQLAFLSA